MVEAAIGLRVNWSNSTLSPVGDVPGVKDMASVIRCDVISLPIDYLGLPLRAKPSSKEICNPVLDKMGNRLTRWKSHCLSFIGKLILLKNVLASMPIYFLSLYLVLVSVLHKLDSIRRDFLWGSSRGKRKIHLVN